MEREIDYEITCFASGLRLVSCWYPDSNVEYFGIAVGAGSAMENEHEHGLAHFVEHTLFKGTTHHSSNYIINCIESVGGELNAFTNKEETVIFSITPKGNINKSISLIYDIVNNSTFPEKELDKERTVIAEEIDSYLDSPAEAIYDELDERLFKGTPFAHNILGTKTSILSFNSDKCKNWLNRYYSSRNSVVFYSGPLAKNDIVKKVEKVFQDYRTNPHETTERAFNHSFCTFNEIIENPSYHQCHVAAGFLTPGFDWELQPEMLLLSNMLGGPCMNSILSLNLREKKGLVYTIDSSVTLYSDQGEAVIYYGCDKDDENYCKDLVIKELKKISSETIGIGKLEKAKKQYLGQLTISLENREQTIMNAARSFLTRNRIYTGRELKEKILSITPERLLEAAQYLSPTKASWLVMR